MEITQTGGSPARLPEPVIYREQTWFARHKGDRIAPLAGRITASRWTGCAREPREEISETKSDCHVVGIALRPMDLTAFASEKLIHDGRMPQGMMRVNEPGVPMRGIFRGGYDTLHLHVPNAIIAECLEARRGGCRNPTSPLGGHELTLDPVIERLANALIRAEDFGGSFGQSYADGVSIAILARLFGKIREDASAPGRVSASGLPKWRLKRATDYMDAHLSEPIGLADIAASAGLTRMHFAAQFRASTGLRPHEYLLRRRIERAQDLLSGSPSPLIEVAAKVGFKTQAHFTTVFSRFTGETPNTWRRQTYAAYHDVAA